MSAEGSRIATAAATKAIIQKHGFPVKKSYGQNFLVDPRVIGKIMAAADISEEDWVVEIGPGLGGLTQYLAEAAGKVIAIEIDRKLIPILEETLAGFNSVELINDDVLKVDFDALLKRAPGRVKIVANLPYYITTPIIMGFLERKLPISTMVVMVQKEVAARMTAVPGSKDYGALSIAVSYYCDAYLAANVPQNCFIPRPDVDSAVVRLSVYERPPVTACDESLLFSIVKCAFAMRRKTLLNCLFSWDGATLSKNEIKTILDGCGFDERVRGEALGLKDFATLTDAVAAFVKKKGELLC